MKTKNATAVKTDNKFKPEQKDAILRLLRNSIGNDGHSVFTPEILSEFPEPIRDRLTRVQRSNPKGGPKACIFDREGHMIKEVSCVYSLNVLYAIAADLGISYESKLGRGFQAQVITFAIINHLSPRIQL